MSSGEDSCVQSEQSRDSSIRAAEAFIPVWIELECLLPNFTSRHVRRFCRSLVQGVVEREGYNSKHGGRVEGPVCIRRKDPVPLYNNNADSTDDLCQLGRCFCDLLKPSKKLEFMSVLIVDISDFSSRMSSLKEDLGSAGLEQFSRGIKRYFDGIIQKVLAYGGDIVKFAGDSVITCWRVEPDHLAAGEEPSREEAVYQSFKCAHSLLQRYGKYVLGDYGPLKDTTLQIHACLGAGEVYDVNVGVKHSRWEHFLAGHLIRDLGIALNLAKGGELSITKNAYEILCKIAVFDHSAIIRSDDIVILKDCNHVERVKPALPLSVNSVMGMWENVDEREGCEIYKKFISGSAVYKLEMDVLQSKLFFDHPTLSDLLGFYELREAATLFVGFPFLSDWNDDLALSKAQSVMEIAVRIVDFYGGVLRQFNYDDKGASMLVFFGIPPSSGAKCAYNAVAAAVEMRRLLSEVPFPFSIGMASGTVFISGVGNSVRTEYCAIGYSINLGARLMCLNPCSGTILCDEQIALSCGWNFIMKEVEVFKSLKGFVKTLRIFEVVNARPTPPSDPGLMSTCSIDHRKTVIGLPNQRKNIKEVLGGTSKPCCMAIVGEHDQGLTTLFEYSVSKVKSVEVSSVNIVCKDRERFNQLSTIKRIVKGILHILDEQFSWRRRSTQNITKSSKQRASALGSALKNTIGLINQKSGNVLHSGAEGTEQQGYGKVFSGNNNSSPTLESPITELLNSTDPFYNRLDITHTDDISTFRANVFRESNLGCNMWRKLIQVSADYCHSADSRVYSEALFAFEAAWKYKIVIIVHELQYMDVESWDLLWYSIRAFPNLRVLLFARSNSIADKVWLKDYCDFTRSPQYLSKLTIGKLTKDEISMLVAHFWPFNSKVKGITGESLNVLCGASSGSPFCVASIILWIQSSGRWKVLPGGVIEFDFGILGGSSDDYNAIVTSQFDQLGPRFRLILKVASVAAPEALFDDIYKILMRARWVGIFGLKPKHAERNKKLLKKLDIYNFLDLEIYRGKLYLKFSSVKIQNLIYSMNVVSQRAPLHKLIADKCSERFLVERHISYLCSAIYHYEKSGPSSNEILIKYIEILARHKSGSGTITNRIELYMRLLLMAGSKPDASVSVFSSVWKWRVIQAHWCIKIAKLHAISGNYDEFEKFLFHALCLTGCVTTKNRDGICTYCGLEIGQLCVDGLPPLTTLASQIRQKLKQKRSIPNMFMNYVPREPLSRMTLLSQYDNTVSAAFNTQYAIPTYLLSTKTSAFDMEGIGRNIIQYIHNANESYDISDIVEGEMLSKVPTKDIDYVDNIKRRIREEDSTLVNLLIANVITKCCAINSIVVNKESPIYMLPLIFDLIKSPEPLEPRQHAKICAVTALSLSICAKDMRLIANCVDDAIRHDDLQKPSTTTYIIINLIHTLFYISLWSQCEVATMSYYYGRCHPYTGYTEQTVFHSILTSIRLFLSNPVSKLYLALSQLFTISIKVSSGFAGFYTNLMLNLYSLVISEKQAILPLPSRPPTQEKEVIFQEAISLYSKMRYLEDADPSYSADLVTKIIKKKSIPLSPVTVLSITLLMVCYVAYLLRDPCYYRQKRSKSILKFAKVIIRLYNDKNLPENLNIMTKPLFSLCTAVVNIFRKGPTGVIGPLKDTLTDQPSIKDNLYIRAVFSSFLLELGDQNNEYDDPTELFSRLEMTYHVENGVFGLGIPKSRKSHYSANRNYE